VNHQSAIGEQALEFFRKLYEVEREARDVTPDERRRLRKEQAEPVATRCWRRPKTEPLLRVMPTQN
jgi:hypothetical protein